MPSYHNFRNSFRRDNESKNIFLQRRTILKESDISEERRNRLIDWITMYRRNIQLFCLHYFQIDLFPYQQMWLYEMGRCDSFVAICSRTTGKTWLLAVFACAKAVLYPNSEIVVVSSTKDQAGNLIDKISSLRNDYPNVTRELIDVVTNTNKWEATFQNGSVIRVVAARDSSRGKRSTFTIYDEFRLIEKEVVDSVLRKFSYVRQTPYMKLEKYQNIEALIEEAKEVFISSAYHKGLWWFDETKANIRAMLKGENTGFFAIDYCAAIKHNLITKKQIKRERSKMDEITALEEIDNIPWGESSDAYFRLKMFERARTLDQAFYPQKIDNYNPKKNPYGIPKVNGEIRIVSCDTAQRAGKANDLSITSCLRLLPTHKGYFRELVYMESFSGVDSITQARRIKEVYFDFEADILVLDVAAGGGGLPIYDQLGVVTRDSERGVDYPPMSVMKHSNIDDAEYEELSTRTLGLDPLRIIFPISANVKLNSQLAVEMRDKLQKKMFGVLCDEIKAEEYLIKSNREFLKNDKDSTLKSFFLAPYVQVSLWVNECIGLSMSLVSGNLKLVEQPGRRKDRYTSVAMGNLVASYYDQELLRVEDSRSDLDFLMSVTYVG